MLEINDKNFEEKVLKEEKLVMVDFWAPWCGPCKTMKPILELIESETANVLFTEYNVDDSALYSGKYNIRSIPTIMFFKDGEIIEQFIGATSKNVLVECINKYKK